MDAKLSRTNGILTKLRHYVPKKTMLSVYYALFYSHMTYGRLVWSLTTQKNLDSIFVTKKSIRIINFATFNHHTNPLFLEDKIIKFPDIIKLNQLMLVQQFNNKNITTSIRKSDGAYCKHSQSFHMYFIQFWSFHPSNFIYELW